MDRKSKMRGREIEHDARPESDSEALSLSPSPAPRIGGNLSSMVVKPSLSSGGGSDLGYTADDRSRESQPRHLRRESPQDPHRRDSPVSSRRRIVSSPQHRRVSPDPFPRRVSQPGIHRGGSLMGFPRQGSPPEFHPRSQRFQNGPVAKLPGLSPRSLLRKNGFH